MPRRFQSLLIAAIVVQGNSFVFAAPIVLGPDTDSAWRYSFLSPAPVYDETHVPDISEVATAVFQGYVLESTTDIGWHHAPPYSPALYTFHLFETVVLSDIDQTIALFLEGDDGHSLYVDGVNVGGGGYGSIITYDLALTAGVPVSLGMVGYNSGGGWVWILQEDDSGLDLPLSSVPNLRMNAEGVFVPEVSSIALLSASTGVLGLVMAIRRRMFVRTEFNVG